MQLALPCDCGGLMVVYDRRKAGVSGYQVRAKCECGESTKVVFPMEGNFMLLRPRRKEVLDHSATHAKMKPKEPTNGKDKDS